MTMLDHFPLQPICDDHQHEQAVKIIGELMNRELGVGLNDYLGALILLVNKYEDENHSPIDLDLSPRDALKAIMRANGLSQADIGKIIGRHLHVPTIPVILPACPQRPVRKRTRFRPPFQPMNFR